MQNNSVKALARWTISEKFLRLAEASCAQLVANGNKHVLVSEGPIDYEEATRWSDFSVGLPILFNFFHGIELLLKGFLVLAGRKPANRHELTILLSEFERLHNGSQLAQSLARNIRDIDADSPLGKHLKTNSIKIDDWYQALKYPESTKGQPFSHFDLKYGGSETLSFWQELGESARQLREQAVKLSCQIEAEQHTQVA